jgi:hypothetical protein
MNDDFRTGSLRRVYYHAIWARPGLQYEYHCIIATRYPHLLRGIRELGPILEQCSLVFRVNERDGISFELIKDLDDGPGTCSRVQMDVKLNRRSFSLAELGL